MSQVWRPGYRKAKNTTILAVAGKKRRFCRKIKLSAVILNWSPRFHEEMAERQPPRLDEGRKYPMREGFWETSGLCVLSAEVGWAALIHLLFLAVLHSSGRAAKPICHG